MRLILLFVILGAVVGGGYEAFQMIEPIRMGAYSPVQGVGFILAGAIVGAAASAAASIVYHVFASRRK